MDINSKSVVKNLLKKYGIQPSKGLGQNFLVDRMAIRRVAEAADARPGEIILEIGPGLGVLTQELAKRAQKVVAVEKDSKMVKILGNTLNGIGNIEIILGDIRKIQSSKLKTQNHNSKLKIIGNLPFYLTAPVIRKFLEGEYQPKEMVFIIQKEVAQRICAKPPRMNLLAVSVQFYSEPQIISYISKKSFWPSPKVDAAIIKITPKLTRYDRVNFWGIVRAGFSQPRKQLINNLSKGLKIDKNKVGDWLLANGIQPNQRAETLNVDDWKKLTSALVSNNIETEA